MSSRSLFRIRALAGAALLLACADGASTPTQQLSARSTTLAPSARSADLAVTPQATPNVIYACYVPDKGTMYRIKTADTMSACDKKDVEMSWQDQGTGNITGIVFASAAVTLPSDGRYLATCPAGKSVMNFGWEIPPNSTANASQIVGNRPAVGAGQLTWGFHAAAGTNYVFYWNCADADPYTLAQ